MFKSKAKGSAFERLVAGYILAAANKFRPKKKHFTKKQCFRTPASGGHIYIGGSDLQIHRRLRRYFPFLVECKHRKNWKPEQMFSNLKAFQEFVDQVSLACKTDKYDRKPLIVIRGRGGHIYAACHNKLYGWCLPEKMPPGFVWTAKDGREWSMVLLSEFLKPLSERCKRS